MDTQIDEGRARAWIAKAQPLVDVLLPDLPPVWIGSRSVGDPADAPYGGFMMGWPESDGDGFVLGHLVECGFFLTLLRHCYAPVLEKRPDLAVALTDGSRLEVAITNDVLQVRAPGPPGEYSMIRHHALMLFTATRWLAEPARSRWLELYDEAAMAMMADRRTPPSAAEIADTEAAAFREFTALATESHAADATGLLDRTDSVLCYQTFAAAAIAVLARACHEVAEDRRDDWIREQLATGYRDPHYLLDDWRRLL